jgi:hypothetical protein
LRTARGSPTIDARFPGADYRIRFPRTPLCRGVMRADRLSDDSYFTPTFYRASQLGDLEFMFASQLN